MRESANRLNNIGGAICVNIVITTKKYHLTDDLRARIDKKLQKLDRYFHQDSEAAVRLYTEKSNEIAEVTILSGGMHFRADARSHEMFHALESAVDSLERQLRKHKTRLEKRLLQGAFTAEASPEEEAVEEEAVYDLIKQKRFTLKPMDIEEAILQMNLLGHLFYVYRSAEDNSVCVVYLRKDGGYGQIVVE